ncbi:heat shock protein HslJ [Pelagimonas varians]|uniref:META domain protein n=2 Tax=Pelagimonas varians TaxID=696760 RepID=A0A238KMD8_9RHOB|nr:heat shock protein HslJ [Pelagimonas varians]SMX43850.1 META domain protein [Pelagimonas varians]
MRLAIATSSLLASGCVSLENVNFYGGVGKVWTLSSIDGAPAPAGTDLRIGHLGALSGHSGCNTWQAKDTSVYPWFEVETISTTLTACPEQAAEQEFYEALKAMTIAEVVGETLILSTIEGREMLFKSVSGETSAR